MIFFRSIVIALIAFTSIFSINACSFQIKTKENDKIAIVAHRGYWKNDQAQGAQNSIAALRIAQEYGFAGSEFDVHLSSDGVLLVNHDNSIDGIAIQENAFSALDNIRLSNGECVPTLDDYLSQGLGSDATLLVFELKPQADDEKNILLVEKGIEALKKYDLFDPSRVAFISFSYTSCKKIAELAPEFSNQYLNGDKSPAEVHKDGINGIDYNYSVLQKNPDWVAQAHELGMKVNVWTIDSPKLIQEMIDLGVDIITTNEPVLVRSILGSRELYIFE